jgi:hypothetical protein
MKLSMGRGVASFNAEFVELTPVKDFPRDTENKLQNAEIKWQGQFFGPESLTFDAQGRGPYTGVSDGRILRYNGPELGWTTFAYTSTNRYFTLPLSPILHPSLIPPLHIIPLASLNQAHHSRSLRRLQSLGIRGN